MTTRSGYRPRPQFEQGYNGQLHLSLGVSGLAGKFRDDESLPESCDEIYRERDAERPR